MAAPRFTHAFAASHHCHLCGSDISLAYASRTGESWKAYVQELRHASPSMPRTAQALVPPRLCAHRLDSRDGEEARLVHAACWAVVTRLWDRDAFTAAELDGFLDCARDAGPFLPEIRFREAPDRLDVTIDHRLGVGDIEYRPAAACSDEERQWESLCAGLEDEGFTPPALLGLRRHELPEHVDGFVAYARQQHGAGKALAGAGAGVRSWVSVVSLLTPCLADGGSVAQALRNLYHGGAARFPHTANHDVVRANALTILLRLLTIPVEDVFAADGARAGRRAKLESPRAVPLAGITPDAPFRLGFLTLRREHYGDYFNEGRPCVGMRYLRCVDFEHHKGRAARGDVVPAIGALCGLRLFRDRIGTLAVHAKDGPDWHSVWQQDAMVQLSGAAAARPTAAEWPAGATQGHLLVISDTIKDQAVFDRFSQYMRETGWPEDARPRGFESMP
ncbi:hypothetical protein TOPH_06366 [Tolypocladium ophioglossoides CBS 100239]|uniref:Uncharacterized protein n=1 Tax=Tolypocladium ophioglossoides (strain CBS 100239) TaxID=1163406 RepID=A0A0L0N4R6_TOLOC|nr:hypothetical protein TOPH_06366 [Tolypocladium ophioglossoides CBS 100239]